MLLDHLLNGDDSHAIYGAASKVMMIVTSRFSFLDHRFGWLFQSDERRKGSIAHVTSQLCDVTATYPTGLRLQDHLHRFGRSRDNVGYAINSFVRTFPLVYDCLVVAVRENGPLFKLFPDSIISFVRQRDRASHIGRQSILHDIPSFES